MRKLLTLFCLMAVATAVWAENQGDNGYTLVFSDEFDQADGSLPDATKWVASTRRSSTWNRWISSSPEVAYIRDGALVCRAIPNPDTSTDKVPMITGAMETKGRFSFTYGKVEVRLKTNRHKGNFPAAWMMPQPPADSWPAGGEIDIFESIDAQNTAYHTIHTHWTYTLGYKNNPKSSFSEWMDVENWHVYGLIWEPERLVWTVDGNEVGRYEKSTIQYSLDNGQWPFDHAFYLILNQSVGNGSWAANADTEYTYETHFDYVRVYQKATSGIDNLRREGSASQKMFDLQGREVGSVQDISADTSTLPKGIYVVNHRKFVVK